MLHTIALLEASKGVAALAALIGVLDLMHHDVRRLVMALIGHFGANPDARYPSLLLHYADLLPGANVHLLVVIGSVYVIGRLLEAYGLWNDRAWGEWLGVLSGGLYIPFEINHLWHRSSVMGVAVCAVNVIAVAFLAYRLWRRTRGDAAGT